MQPIFYVMAILGCGDVGTGCEAVRTPQARYASAAACKAAAESILIGHTDLDYPMLRADCRKAMRAAVLKRPG
jgi:hypothetical protein